MGLDVGGFTQKPDWPKLGPTLVIASSLILAIRTAKCPARASESTSSPEWTREIEYAVKLAATVLGVLMSHHESFFPRRKEPWFVPNDDDVPR